jgi:hypothetical protein
MGLEKNDSPLSRLFTAYRKTNAGLKNLIPGTKDGSGLNSGLVSEYKEKFSLNDPDYQSDEKWYELARLAEKGKRGDSTGAADAGGDFPLDDEPPRSGSEAGADEDVGKPQNETALTDKPELDAELSGSYELDDVPGGVVLKVSAYRHKSDINGAPFKVTPEGYSFRFDYNSRSPFFEESLSSPADYLIIDLAQYFLVLSAETVKTMPVSKIVRLLRDKYFSRASDDLSSCAIAASSLLEELLRHYDEVLPSAAPIDTSKLPARELGRIKRSAAQSLGLTEIEIDDFITEGRFASYVSPSYVVELVRQWPELVTDGEFFDRPYVGSADELKPLILDEVIECLQNTIWLVDEGASAVSKDTGWRLRYAKSLSAMRLLQYWRV